MDYDKNIPIPPLLAERPRDERGLPIPYITMIHPDTKLPDFRVLDHARWLEVVRKRLCGLCGHSLPTQPAEPICFIGDGSSCSNCAFIDPAMHEKCARYAMRVCPYIAIPGARRKEGNIPPGAHDLGEVMTKEQPQRFGLYYTTGFRVGRLSDATLILIANPPTKIVWQGEESNEDD